MKNKLEKINNMSRDEAVEYLQKVHQSTLIGRERTVPFEVYEVWIDGFNWDSAMVTKADFDD